MMKVDSAKEEFVVPQTGCSIETPDIETSSEDYATRFSGKVGEWFLRVQEKATLRMLSEWQGATVLDVGGGHGQLTRPLLSRGYDVTVVGSDDSCQNRIRDCLNHDRCRFEVGNVLQLPFENKSFDLVISFRLVPHVEQWPRLISELTRVARKAVVVDYPTLRSINYLTPILFKLKKTIEGNTRYYRSFYENELIDSFLEHGFVKAGRYGEFFLPMVMHRALKLPLLSSFLEGVCRGAGLTALFGSPVILKMIRRDV
ncbi:MAG: class I SAM-dependent methyltransferase [bacterium]